MSDYVKDMLYKILNNQESMSDDISDIKVEIAKNTKDLELHIYRTEQNEQLIEHLRKEVEPLKEKLIFWKQLTKLFVFLGILGALATAIIKIVKLL